MKKTILCTGVLFSSLVFSQTGNVGINTSDPKTTLDVHAINHNGPVSATDGILVPRVNDLIADGTSDGQLVYLTEDNGAYTRGFHYWDASIPAWKAMVSQQSATNNNEIQVMRFGINGKTAGTSYAFNVLNALRFDKYNDYREFGLTPSYDYNYMNSIVGSSYTEGVTLNTFNVPTGETAVPATRTTDVVNLPAGTYEITVRIYTVQNGTGNINSTARVLLSVNNTYSSKSYSNIGGGATAVNNSTFLVNLRQPSSLDFLLEPQNPIPGTTVDVIDVSTMPSPNCWPGYVVKSDIIIKKLSTYQPSLGMNCPT